MKYATCRDQMHFYQFLMALHDDYESVRGQLLHQIPTPSLDVALNELICEETRLQTLQAQNNLNILARLLHPFSSPNLISLAQILIVQIGNLANFADITRSMATLLRLVIVAIEALLLLLMVILIRHPLLLLLRILDPPSHSPQINWRTSSLILSSGLVMHPLPLLFLSCLVSYPHGFLTLPVAIT